MAEDTYVSSEALQRPVRPGEILKPWLMLGPFYLDMSKDVRGLTLFERAGAVVGRAMMTEVVQEAEPLLASEPKEAEVASFQGVSARWGLVRRPEKYLSWGSYHIDNHLAAVFLSTCLTPSEAGQKTWRLVTRITSRALVAVNGRVVFDAAAHEVTNRDGSFEYRFEAELAPGENRINVALFRLGRMAQVGCRLELIDASAEVQIPLGEGMSRAARERIEAELSGLRLSRDIFYPEDDLGLSLEQAPEDDARVQVRLVSEAGEILREVNPSGAGFVGLATGEALPDGRYQLECVWSDRSGKPITAACYPIYKLTPAPNLSGPARARERRERVLEHYQHHRDKRLSHGAIWPEVARYALGRFEEVDEGVIRDVCRFIAARKDCADFAIQGVLRLMAWEHQHSRLSPGINAMMKDTLLGFKYWVDEPGDTVMYMGSENHRLLFHVAEWLAGQLFPTEEFTNSRQRGLYHATKGRMYITEWLRQRGRFGFDEWHSNSYYPICLAPLVNIYDFAIGEDYKLRQMASAVLDYMSFILAADTFQGVFGTTHGRSYGVNIKYPDLEGTSASCWLLYGTGSLVAGSSGMAPVSLATSDYQPPAFFADIATDETAVVESRVRQGLLRGSAPQADFCVYRTPDYLLSGLQDHRKGEYESSTHVAQVTLPNKVVIFWSCPHTSGEGSGLRPDYWSGHTTLPRVIQHRNVMSLSWRLSKYAWMTHCFFEQARMDEVRFAGNWAFARVKQGYVGIYSQHGMRLGDFGQYAGRELVCEAPENTWLVECGREADWGSFDAFVEALSAAPVEVDDRVISYLSPSVGRFVTGWDTLPMVDGKPVELHGYPLVASPWAQATFGSGELTVRYGDERYEIWFNQ